MTLPSVSETIVTGGASGVDKDIYNTFAVIGCCEGSTVAVDTPRRYSTATRARDAHGEGPATRLACHIMQGARRPAVIVRATAATAGSYGTIDVSGFTGTAVPEVDSTAVPLDEYQLYVRFPAAGTVATGLKYQFSEDGGRTKKERSLGATLEIPFSEGGCNLLLSPPLSGLVALATDLRADVIAHAALTAGSVHGAADATSFAAIPGVPVTEANVIALANYILTGLAAHVILTSGSVHGAADTTAQTALAALSAATTGQEARALLIALKGIYNAHRVLTAGSVHGAADATNITNTADPAVGTVDAGDVIEVRTVAPTYDSDGISAAMLALAVSNLDVSKVIFATPINATLAAAIKTGLNEMATRGKIATAHFATRGQGEGEDQDDVLAAVTADFASFSDARLVPCAERGRCTINNGSRIRIYDVSWLPNLMARWVALDRVSRSPWEIALGPLEGVQIYDGNGDRIHHDEAEYSGDGYNQIRMAGLYRVADPQRSAGAYVTPTYVLRGDEDRVFLGETAALEALIRRIVRNVSFGEIGKGKIYTPTPGDPTTGTLSAEAASAFANLIKAPLRAALANDISNPDDVDLVTVSRNIEINGEDITIHPHVRYITLGRVVTVITDIERVVS